MNKKQTPAEEATGILQAIYRLARQLDNLDLDYEIEKPEISYEQIDTIKSILSDIR